MSSAQIVTTDYDGDIDDDGGDDNDGDVDESVIVGEPVLLRAVKKRDGDKEEISQDRYHHHHHEDDDDEEDDDDVADFPAVFLIFVTKNTNTKS